MRNYTGYIIDYSDGNLSNHRRKWFEKELEHSVELRSEYNCFKQINEFMRAKHDLEEVRNDHSLQIITPITNQMISEFNRNHRKYKDIREFVDNSTKGNELDAESHEKLYTSRVEAKKNNINDVTEKWVEEWNSKNQVGDNYNEDRRAFISSSLRNEGNNNGKKLSMSRTSVLRIAILTAAAMIAAIVYINTFSPSERSEKLYQEYYKPLIAYSSTTRNSTIINDPFSAAVEMYKQGQYVNAASLLTDLTHIDSSKIAPLFFSGITQLELGDYNQAIILLKAVIAKNGDYKKEAQWYLGLSYIKIGETQKAASCFKELAESKGYYQNQAQSLLDQLK
ncbi:MAG: hypothetical protein EHM93_13135 [Bacteroidales bacterium]|nr:MAG: hypothetical protein EHM93_13135 [Bacteroidales bacterium]